MEVPPSLMLALGRSSVFANGHCCGVRNKDLKNGQDTCSDQRATLNRQVSLEFSANLKIASKQKLVRQQEETGSPCGIMRCRGPGPREDCCFLVKKQQS
eukprot:1146217-Pelagomonas_calceolata.AAC.6